VKYGFIQAQAGTYPVRVLCRALAVSKSGYYAWHGRQPSARRQANCALAERIRRIHANSRGTYGSPRVHRELRDAGVQCSLNRVARVMREHDIRVQRRPRYIVTTESGGTFNAAPNLLRRRFRPGTVQAWLADLTYVRTDEGMLYLTVVLNLYSRRVIGWSMDSAPSGKLALAALKMALEATEPRSGLIHHSDRGGHYASNVYRALLARHGLVESMSRRADCWDNAVVESFFATLKRELLYPQRIRTRPQARSMIFEYIEVFYNRQRRHSALGYLSPVEYEKLHPDP